MSARRSRRSTGAETALGAALAFAVGAGLLAVTTPSHTAAAAAPAKISSVVPVSSAHRVSTVYTVTVNGQKVPVNGYDVYDYAQFSMSSGPATVVVTRKDGTKVAKSYISPQKQGYKARHSGATATFTLRGAEYLIVKLDGLRKLVIAADPAETDKPASTGTGVFNVTKAPYGADATGATPSTAALQKALDAASAYGSKVGNPRGVVYVPRGLYPVGNLTIRSNTAVYLEPGAVLRVVADKSLYRVDAHKTSQRRDLTWWIRTATGSNNIKMYGRGTLDGNGMAATKAGFGMNVLVPMATSDFTLDGLTIREGASWSVMPVRSDRLTFTNMKVYNRFDMGENDAFDAVESQRVTVRRGIGISLDDPYSTKTWPKNLGITKNWPGEPEKVSDVTFDGLLSWTYCYGFKVGQGVVADQDRVTFKNSVVYDASIGIGIHHQAGKGVARNVTFSNIDIERLTYKLDKRQTWISFDIGDQYNDGAGPIDSPLVSHIKVRAKGSTPGTLKGFSATSDIRGLTLDSVKMPGATTYARTLREMNITEVTHTREPRVIWDR
ncbi:glycosyl hydrolase family 28-related protein [Streptomyces sp. YS415]|uniref:glycosyl hydrolase family 28-related protein n=1 Tax=Streptomyces sp. YS415 TaxID=2944806 RepID=UPI0020216686|nr:glycosyl hydrolase family 28-related protein [Streptomyces sp. YS415]MCL7430314.1 coagulation factor 5/8 type domain-containing protein [Streptomyces sp. YS415]